MPKDNEVDEKVIADNAARELIANTEPAKFVAYSYRKEGTSMTICVTSEEHERIVDALKATVAELRAEVDRLRKSNELYSFAMNTAGIDELKRRADAAERRVGELEAEISRWQGLYRSMELVCEVQERRIERLTKLTGADPT